IRNLTDHELQIHTTSVLLHVENEKGERPTTVVQRTLTGKLRAGDEAVATGEYVGWSIAPGASSQRKYRLSYFYDLTAPGKHKVYMDVQDPTSHKWMRTNTAAFKMEAPTQ